MMKTKYLNFIKKLPKKLNSFYLENSQKSIVIKNKSKNRVKFDPVTNLDKSFEKFIRNLITKKFPKDSIVGEEFKDKISSNKFKWTIDPIDGTKAFIEGASTWSNLIGLSIKKKSVLGLANFPKLKKYYFNDEKKTYVFKNKKIFIVNIKGKKKMKTFKIIGNFRTTSISKKNRIIRKLGKKFQLKSFDAMSFCMLAEGKVDAVIEANLKTFDILPLIPIIQNSGNIVTTWTNKSAENAGNIVASSNRILHDKLIKLLK